VSGASTDEDCLIAESEAFLAGVKAAYLDCSAMADQLAGNGDGFKDVAAGLGLDSKLTAIVEQVGSSVLSTFSEAIRDKVAELDSMISAARNGYN